MGKVIELYLLCLLKEQVLDYHHLLAALKKQQYEPIYFLHGEEPFYIDELITYFEDHVLTESEKAFNQTIFYGKDADFLTVLDAARRYPMMSSHQLVIIKEAQDMKTLANLEGYVEKPQPSTILVIGHKYKKLNMSTKLGRILKEKAVVFESKPLYDNQMPAWIESRLKSKGYSIAPEASTLIAEYLGTELSKVSNELDKLYLNIEKGKPITEKDIENNIGISKEYNVFELQKALGTRNIALAQRIVQHFGSNSKKNPMVVVVGSLFNYFSKIYRLHYLKNMPEKEVLQGLGLHSSYFLKEYQLAVRNYPLTYTTKVIEILHEYDLKSKGVDYNSTGKDESSLMQEMVYRILHLNE